MQKIPSEKLHSHLLKQSTPEVPIMLTNTCDYCIEYNCKLRCGVTKGAGRARAASHSCSVIPWRAGWHLHPQPGSWRRCCTQLWVFTNLCPHDNSPASLQCIFNGNPSSSSSQAVCSSAAGRVGRNTCTSHLTYVISYSIFLLGYKTLHEMSFLNLLLSAELQRVTLCVFIKPY